MDGHKKHALLQWVKCLIQNECIVAFNDIDTEVIKQLLKSIETELVWDDEDFFTIVNDIFKPASIKKELIYQGEEVEVAKLLCLALEYSLTGSSHNGSLIRKIQMLSEEVQMNIMSITKTVSDNIQEVDFNTIIEDMLGKNVSVANEGLDHSPVLAAHPSKLFQSPMYKLSSPIGNSPLSSYVSSPQAMMRRVMVENKKLKQKLKQSEVSEQIAYDSESSVKKELLEINERLVKEQDCLNQKVFSLEESVNKYKEEIEFLQLEASSKDTETSDLSQELKNNKDVIAELQLQCKNLTQLEEDITKYQHLYKEEVNKKQQLNLTVNQTEQLMSEMKRELLESRETIESFGNKTNELKKDHGDYVSHLEHKIKNLENIYPDQKINSKRT